MAKNQLSKSSYKTENTILFNLVNADIHQALLSDEGVTEVDGKKIVYAGTPVLATAGTNCHIDMQQAYKIESKLPTALLMDDTDVTYGAENTRVLVMGNVDLKKVSEDVRALYTSDVLVALDRAIRIISK